MPTEKKILLGAHVSIAKGFAKSIQTAQEIGATCFQIFTKSNRQWFAKKIKIDEINNFLQTLKKSNIQAVIVHASYLINLGSTTHAIAKKSIQALSIELERCQQLKIKYLVLHPGTIDKNNKESSLIKIANNLDSAITVSKTKDVILVLETMAGQGNTAGSTLEELAFIIKHSKYKNRIGVCIDTAHLFASGYDLSNIKSYTQFWHMFAKIIGKRRLKVIHLNDSKKEFGSKVDRHEHIGKGKIGITSFKLIMNDPQLKKIIKIVETPEEDNKNISDKKNIETLKNLIK